MYRPFLKLIVALFCITFVAGCKPDTTYNRKLDPSIPDPPPKPNFDDPVNYVAWTLKRLESGHPSGDSATFENFWEQTDGSDKMPSPDQNTKKKIDALINGPSWQDEDYPNVANYLDQMKPWLENFRAVIEKGSIHRIMTTVPKDETNPINILLPSLGPSRRAAQALLLEAWRGNNLDVVKLVEASRLVLQHSEQLNASNILVTRSVGWALEKQVYDTLRSAFLSQQLSHQVRRTLRELLSNHRLIERDFTESVRLEWAFSLGAIQALYPSGRLNRKELVQYAGANPDQLLNNPLAKSPVTAVRIIDEYFEHVYQVTLINEPLRRLDELEKADRDLVKKSLLNPLGRKFCTSFTGVFEIQIRNLAAHRSTLLLLNIFDYRDEHGRWPGTIDEVCQPADICIDPTTGEKFEYQVGSEDDDFEFRLDSEGERLRNDAFKVVYPLPDEVNRN